MHELAIIESLLESVSEKVQEVAADGDGHRGRERRVAVVRMEVGRLSCVAPAALRFCFDVCSRGTVMEGAALEIAEISGRAQCERCGGEFGITSYVDVCACGGMSLRVIAGEELRVKNLEIV